MAAPNGTKWGSTVGGYGCIGIYAGVTNTATQTKVNIQVWFWSKYGVSDSGNSYYFNVASTATTKIGSVNIKTSVNSGAGWSTSNQVKIGESNFTYTKGTSKYTKYYAAKLTGIDRVGGTMTVSTSVSVPAKASYTVTYNANGGTGAPGAQTKWYGTDLKLSSGKPSRTGYTFQGWSITGASGSVYYQPGATCKRNENLTLYAVWKINTYTVSYNANGGTGAPGAQTKTYGTDLTLSSAIPVRENYDFLGWGTSAESTSVAYAPGSVYKNNEKITLYALWKLSFVAPKITNFFVDRCDTSGNFSDDGTNAKVVFDWETESDVSAIGIEYKANNIDTWTSVTVTGSGKAGHVEKVIATNEFSIESSYDFRVTVADPNISSNSQKVLSHTFFTMDFLAGGKGVSLGKPATRDGFDVGMPMFDRFGTDIGNGLVKYETAGIDPDTTIEHAIVTHINTPMGADKYMYVLTYFYSGKSETAHRMQVAYPYNANGSVYHRYYVNGAWTAWRRHVNDNEPLTNLWEGAWTMHATQKITLPTPISKQKHGVVLTFSAYRDGVAKDQEMGHFFVPKNTLTGGGTTFNLTNHFYYALKYLYIKDTTVSGHEKNGQSITYANGATYHNNYYVLRRIYGV